MCPQIDPRAINKGLWTSSYVVLTGGFACLVLAAFIWIVDVRREAGVAGDGVRPSLFGVRS